MFNAMSFAPARPARWRPPIIGLLYALALLAGGCSSLRLGYNQAPNLAYWWLDGYADFDAIQAQRVRGALADWFAWHRRTQMRDYADLLARAQAEAVADTTPERACQWWADVSQRVEVAAEQAVPAAAAVLVTLGPDQIERIEARYKERNDDYREEFLEPDPAKRRKEAVKRAIERAEGLYGRIDDAQRARIAGMTAESPFDAEIWLAERQSRQQDALKMMRALRAENAGRAQAETALRAYLGTIRKSPREAYRRHSDQLTAYNCAYTAELHNSTTPAQRQAAVKKLKGWETDLRALAADAS